MSTKPLVLVTGVSGFLGSHVAHQLLEAGYRVRGTARAAKVDAVKAGYASYGDKWDVIAFDDLAAGDLTDGLKGVGAVIHIASPLVGRLAPAAALDAAIEGALNILRQSEKAGIKRFVYVSSIGAVINDENKNRTYTDQDWNPTTREQVLDPNTHPYKQYYGTKALAERAVWDFADKHPNIDVTALLPPFFYGPLAPGHRIDDASIKGLSTDGFLYTLLMPQGYPPETHYPVGRFIDVRDIAHALVLALDSPLSSAPGVGRKRILIAAPEWFSFRDAVAYLAEVRPELKGRLSVRAKDAPPEGPSLVDNTRAKQLLGIDSFRHWKVSVLDAVDNIIKLEKEWASKGLTPH